MKDKDLVIKIIQTEIEKFIRDWRRSPYCWNTEVDVQCEIVGRLTKTFKIHKLLKLKALHPVGNGGIKERVTYKRIICEWPNSVLCWA